MPEFEIIAEVAGIGLLICWTSVLVAMLIDKIAGSTVTNFCRPTTDRFYVPKARSRPWWQHLLWLPLYCIFIPSFFLCMLMFIPPMWMVTKVVGQRKGEVTNPSPEPTPPSGSGHL